MSDQNNVVIFLSTDLFGIASMDPHQKGESENTDNSEDFSPEESSVLHAMSSIAVHCKGALNAKVSGHRRHLVQ